MELELGIFNLKSKLGGRDLSPRSGVAGNRRAGPLSGSESAFVPQAKL